MAPASRAPWPGPQDPPGPRSPTSTRGECFNALPYFLLAPWLLMLMLLQTSQMATLGLNRWLQAGPRLRPGQTQGQALNPNARDGINENHPVERKIALYKS